MQNRNPKRKIIFSLLIFLTFPLQVTAAGSHLEKQITLTATSGEDYIAQASEAFPEKIEENGTTYKRAGIAYDVKGTEYLDKKEKTVEAEEVPAETISEDGIEYTLISSDSREEVVEEQSSQTVTAYDEYSYAVTAIDVPSTKTVTAQNETTGETEQVICAFVGISPAGTETVTNTITITVSNYDAAYYEWNGHYIPRNDETPQLTGYENELLASVGAAEGSSVTGIYWTGEPYTVDGVMCRDAAADVAQQNQLYRANYRGEINTPEERRTVYTARYEAPDPEGAVEYTVIATATYQAETSYLPYILGGVGILILAGLVVSLLMLISKKKKEKESI